MTIRENIFGNLIFREFFFREFDFSGKYFRAPEGPPIIVLMKQLGISSYSLKNLRHALHIYCESSTDCKKLQDKLRMDEVNCYSHDLKEDKHFKVALKQLKQAARTLNVED